MAEIIGNLKSSKKNTHKNIRIDLTPMVDLGFLLLTFFVFTTTMSEKKVTDIVVPNDRDTTTDLICESCALTILAGKNNQVYYYEGGDKNAIYKTTGYAPEGLRKIIAQKRALVFNRLKSDRMILIIKPSAMSNFKNLVDIIDESVICRIKRYYLAELNLTDRKWTD